MKRTKVKALSNTNRVSNLGNAKIKTKGNAKAKAKIKAKGSARVKVMNNGVADPARNSKMKVKTKKGSRRKTVN